MNLYNCVEEPGGGYRITKFDEAFNPEGSYSTTNATCTCPAGVRPTCRHRKMLPKFMERNHIGDGWFFNHDNAMWHRPTFEAPEPAAPTSPEPFRRRV